MRVDGNTTKRVDASKPTIHVVHILDSSGSMGSGIYSKWHNAVKGVQQEIEELKKDSSANYIFSLVVFGRDIKKVIWQQPIAEVNYASEWRSTPSTALYDAIGTTLFDYPQDNPVLVKILTDGEENSSRLYSEKDIKKQIEDLSEKDFTITFVGTKQDVQYIEVQLSIAKGNTLVHDNTSEGIKTAFEKSMAATRSYSTSVATGEFTKTFNFYED